MTRILPDPTGSVEPLEYETCVPPLAGCDPLKRESVVRVLQHRQLALIAGLPYWWLDAILITWLVRHIPAFVLRVAAEQARPSMNSGHCEQQEIS